jgi:hypothetical protein
MDTLRLFLICALGAVLLLPKILRLAWLKKAQSAHSISVSSDEIAVELSDGSGRSHRMEGIQAVILNMQEQRMTINADRKAYVYLVQADYPALGRQIEGLGLFNMKVAPADAQPGQEKAILFNRPF